jgi:diguanylate cyclase
MLMFARAWSNRAFVLGILAVGALALYTFNQPSLAGLALVQVEADGTVIREIAGPPVLLGALALGLALIVLIANGSAAAVAQPATNQDEPNKAEIEEANERLDSSLGSVLEIVRATLASSAKYASLIKSADRDLRRSSNPAAVKKTLEKMHSQNAAIGDEVDVLKGRLEQAKAETEQLKKELQNVKSESLTDGLTGLNNRKWFDARLSEEIAAAHEASERLCLAIVDIDHFKKVNDSYGHQTGDRILTWFGGKILENVKGRDCAARYGGEEFAIILPRTRLQSAASLMDQIRHGVEGVNWKHIKSGRRIGHVTASFGVAELRDGEAASSLVERADANLYAAKSEGRNRVVAR